MKKVILFNLIVLGLILLNISCDPDRKCVKGNGDYITQPRNIKSEFTGVEMTGDFNVFVSRDSIRTVEIDADRNILSHIYTRVKNYRLYIETDAKCFVTDYDINIYVTTPYLSHAILNGSGYIDIDSMDANGTLIELNGSGEIYVDYLNAGLAENELDGSGVITFNEVIADQFKIIHDGSGLIDVDYLLANSIEIKHEGSGEIEILNVDAHRIIANVEGSGILEISGDADDTDFTVRGSGIVKAFRLYQDDCYAYIPGSGTIYVFVYEYLDVNIPGSGFVYFKGNPIVTLIGSTRHDHVIPN